LREPSIVKRGLPVSSKRAAGSCCPTTGRRRRRRPYRSSSIKSAATASCRSRPRPLGPVPQALPTP